MIPVPLHLDPKDNSPKANGQRYLLHTLMAQINPKGWPKPGKKGCVGRAAYLAKQIVVEE